MPLSMRLRTKTVDINPADKAELDALKAAADTAKAAAQTFS